jgi:hypothetical protein
MRGADPIGPRARHARMATPELLSLIVALVLWIGMLGTLTPDR